MRLRSTLVLTLAACLLTGCGYFQFPGIHRVEVQQGNIITQDMVDQLKPGMTKSQVRYIMGTPLVADTFNQNRWDYYYTRKDGNETLERESVTVFFEDDELTHITGDYLPAGAETRPAETEG